MLKQVRMPQKSNSITIGKDTKICLELLRSLYFENLHSRVQNIVDPVEASFQWHRDEGDETGFLN